MLPHAGVVKNCQLTLQDRLVTVSDPHWVRSWNLAPTRLSESVLVELAQLMSGRRLVGRELMELEPTELQEGVARLRKAHPSLFQSSPMDVAAWHRRRAESLQSLSEVDSGGFHQAAWVSLGGQGTERDRLQARIEAAGIPPRSADTPAQALDLSNFYTHSFALLGEQELAALPRGRHALGGVDFDLRGMIRLEAAHYVEQDRAVGRWTHGSLPRSECLGIPVDRACRRIHFLQAVDGPYQKHGEVAASWRIHLADGSKYDQFHHYIVVNTDFSEEKRPKE